MCVSEEFRPSLQPDDGVTGCLGDHPDGPPRVRHPDLSFLCLRQRTHEEYGGRRDFEVFRASSEDH